MILVSHFKQTCKFLSCALNCNVTSAGVIFGSEIACEKIALSIEIGEIFLSFS